MSEDNDTPMEKALGFIVGVLFGGLLLWWYNCLLYDKRLPYWQWCCLAVVWIWLIASNKIIKQILGLFLFAALVVQLFLSWFGVIHTPLIHHTL